MDGRLGDSVVPDLISGTPRRRAAAAAAAELEVERAAGGRALGGRPWHPALSSTPLRTAIANPNIQSTVGSVLYGAPSENERHAAHAADAAAQFERAVSDAAGKGLRWNVGKTESSIDNVDLFQGGLGRGQAIEQAIPGSNLLLPGAVLSTRPGDAAAALASGAALATPGSCRRVAWANGDSRVAGGEAAAAWQPLSPASAPPTYLDDFLQRRGKKPLHYEEMGVGLGYASAMRLAGGAALVDPLTMIAETPHAHGAVRPEGMPSRGRGPSAPSHGGNGERHIFNVGEPGHWGKRLASGDAGAAHAAALSAALSSVAAAVFGHCGGPAYGDYGDAPQTPRGGGASSRDYAAAPTSPTLRELPWYAESAGMATDSPSKQQHPQRPRPPSSTKGHQAPYSAGPGVHLAGPGATPEWRREGPPPPDAQIRTIGGKQRASEPGKAPGDARMDDFIGRSANFDVGRPQTSWTDARYNAHVADSIARVERSFSRRKAAVANVAAVAGVAASAASVAGPKTPRVVGGASTSNQGAPGGNQGAPGGKKPGWKS